MGKYGEGGDRYIQRFVWGGTKRSLVRPRRGWENNIKIYLREKRIGA